jgi:NAD(P)-dependent dehydrogenase (short-subunit alcohol dehydrogenase family)
VRLKDKIAIITGGGGGIGRASCLAFAREGAKVLIADWSERGGRQTEELVRAEGGEVTFRKTNIAEPADVQGMVAHAVTTYGGLHVIHNNAAIVRGYGGPVEAEIDDWDATMAVNVRGTYLCCKFAVPAIIASGGGAVINQSSVAALQGAGPPMSGPCAAYTTSKNAVIGLTRSVAYSYGHKGVRANSIIPGLIATGMTASLVASPEFEKAMIDNTPLRRLGRPEDVATVAAFLASDEASFMSGSEILVDGGCWISQGTVYPEPLLFEDPDAGPDTD